MSAPDVLTAPEAAALLRCTPQTAKRLACAGRVPAVRVAGRWLFSRTQLLQWLEDGGQRNLRVQVVELPVLGVATGDSPPTIEISPEAWAAYHADRAKRLARARGA